MTATVAATTVPQTTDPAREALWKPGLRVAAVAAVATTAVAALASALDVTSFAIDGEEIPLLGFTQLTLIASVVGLGLASVLRRRSSRPRDRFVAATVALTALSLVPDLMVPASAATKVTLMATHLVAAAIVIPAVARRLPATRAA